MAPTDAALRSSRLYRASAVRDESESLRKQNEPNVNRGETLLVGIVFVVLPWTSRRHGIWRQAFGESKRRFEAGHPTLNDKIAVRTDQVFRPILFCTGVALLVYALLR